MDNAGDNVPYDPEDEDNEVYDPEKELFDEEKPPKSSQNVAKKAKRSTHHSKDEPAFSSDESPSPPPPKGNIFFFKIFLYVSKTQLFILIMKSCSIFVFSLNNFGKRIFLKFNFNH